MISKFKMTSTSQAQSPSGGVDFLGAPASKRAKLSAEDGGVQSGNASRHLVPKHLTPIQENHIKSEFPLRSLEDFYKDCPAYRLPVEIGSFSLDNKGKQLLDRSQLMYFSPPPPPTASRLNFDLRVGFDKYVPTPRSVPSDKLNPILRWVAANGDCFRPKPLSPKSPSKAEGDVPQGPGDGTGENGRRVSVGEVSNSSAQVSKERPDNLLTNFVTWRGMLTKILCSPYNKTEPWMVAATLYNGTIYLSEVETEQSKRDEATRSQRQKEMCYWGHKFEDYVTSTETILDYFPEPPPIGRPGTPSTPSPRTGTVNSQRAFCTVVRTRMNTHSIVMAAEVDCCDHMSKEKPPQNYIELKTNRVILTDRNKSSFRRYKLMKWWAQSFLVGVPKIVCGFRDDDGLVKSLQTFKTSTIPHDSQNDLTMWQPAVCLNFLDELLAWVRKVVVCDGPREVYLLEWKEPFTNVSCTKCPPNSEYAFLSDWYVEKQASPE